MMLVTSLDIMLLEIVLLKLVSIGLCSNVLGQIDDLDDGLVDRLLVLGRAQVAERLVHACELDLPLLCPRPVPLVRHRLLKSNPVRPGLFLSPGL